MTEKELLAAGTKIATEVVKERAGEIYDDALKLAAKEAGGVLQAVVGLFNHVVLYPVKAANVAFRYKLELFERDLAAKLESVSPEKIVTPPLAIAGPALEALKYTFDIKELREMYVALLASAMNTDKASSTHPAFVEVIKAMNPEDAHIFRDVVKMGQMPSGRVTIGFESKVFTLATPEFYVPDLLQGRDPFIVSRSVVNLCRLGLLTHRDNPIVDYDYEAFKTHPFVTKQTTACKLGAPGKEISVKVAGEVILLNDFGRAFSSSCLP